MTSYLALLVADIWLMRRYADVDPAGPGERAPAIAATVPRL